MRVRTERRIHSCDLLVTNRNPKEEPTTRSVIRPTLLASALAGALLLSISACTKSADPVTAPVATTSIGTAIDDSVVTANVMSAFVAEADVKSLDLKVETRKGEVQLSGFVDGQTQMDRAVMIATNVQGVNRVSNEMSIKK